MGILDFLFKKERKIPAMSMIKRVYIKKDCQFCRAWLSIYNRILRTTPLANHSSKRIEIVDINKNLNYRDYAILSSEIAGEGRNLSVPLLIYDGIVLDGIVLGAESSYEMMLREIMGVRQA